MGKTNGLSEWYVCGGEGKEKRLVGLVLREEPWPLGEKDPLAAISFFFSARAQNLLRQTAAYALEDIRVCEAGAHLGRNGEYTYTAPSPNATASCEIYIPLKTLTAHPHGSAL